MAQLQWKLHLAEHALELHRRVTGVSSGFTFSEPETRRVEPVLLPVKRMHLPSNVAHKVEAAGEIRRRC